MKGFTKIMALMLSFALLLMFASCRDSAVPESGASGTTGGSGTSTQSTGETGATESVTTGTEETTVNKPSSTTKRTDKTTGPTKSTGTTTKAPVPADNSGNIVTTPPSSYVKQAWETAAENEAKSGTVSNVRIDFAKPSYTITDRMFGAGYDGWNDITSASGIRYLNDIGVEDMRIEVDLALICGKDIHTYNMEYTKAQDVGLGFTSRIKKVIKNGWTPLLAFSTNNTLPPYFHGDVSDAKGNAWWHYNTDGTRTAAFGNQLEAMSTIASEIASRLVKAGLTGLHYETIYESDASQHAIVEIHYYTAKGVRQSDPKAKMVGPATWPGWSVEEGFIKPYLSKYGADLLDYVSMHWYTVNTFNKRTDLFDYRKDWVNMTSTELLKLVMEGTPQFSESVRRVRKLLDDKSVNPSGKKIGIAYTEYDANPHSPFRHNYNNENFPEYSAKSDTYINTNYYGGVWLAAVMTDTFANSPIDIMMKFTTRSYYGFIENIDNDTYYRQPVWYSVRLLRDGAGMKPGAKMVPSTVTGPMDNGAADLDDYFKKDSPWISAVGIQNGSKRSVVVINRSNKALPVNLTLSGAGGNTKMTRYVYGKDTTARFIGSLAGLSTVDGSFEGLDSTEKYTCIRALNYVNLTKAGSAMELKDYACPAYSYTVFTF